MNAIHDRAIQYYDKIYIRKIKDYVYGNKRVDVALKRLIESGPEDPKRVLEIGCGVGHVCQYMGKLWPKAEVFGVDISQKSIDVARKLFDASNINFLCGVPDELDIQGNFDVILMMDVYEHIPVTDRKRLHDFMKRKLSKHGRIILTFPTPRHLAWLKEEHPDEIQPVDEDVTIGIVDRIAGDINRDVILYKEMDIWHAGDYAHAVLARVEFPTRFPVGDQPDCVSSWARMCGRMLARVIGSSPPTGSGVGIEQRRRLVNEKLGLEL